MQGMRVAAEPLSAPPYATECAMTLSSKNTKCYSSKKGKRYEVKAMVVWCGRMNDERE